MHPRPRHVRRRVKRLRRQKAWSGRTDLRETYDPSHPVPCALWQDRKGALSFCELRKWLASISGGREITDCEVKWVMSMAATDKLQVSPSFPPTLPPTLPLSRLPACLPCSDVVSHLALRDLQ